MQRKLPSRIELRHAGMIDVLANRSPYVSSNADLLSDQLDAGGEADDPLDDAKRLQGEVRGRLHFQRVELIKSHCSSSTAARNT